MIGSGTNRILLDSTSRTWRRRLGPLPWAVVEELALAARQTEQGWIAPVGVRHLGATLGVTKDTAARAVATLRAAGLVAAVRVPGDDGRVRPGYRLSLPEAILIRGCPVNRDGGNQERVTCRDGEYSCCPYGEYIARGSDHATGTSTASDRPDPDNSCTRPLPLGSRNDAPNPAQASLFDTPLPRPG